MGLAKIYDKVSWHFPEGKRCPSLEAAKVHFSVVTQWLKDKGLLSAEGREALENGIDSEFSLTAHMVTAEGNKILGECYAAWVRTIQYGRKPSTDLLEKCLRESKGRG